MKEENGEQNLPGSREHEPPTPTRPSASWRALPVIPCSPKAAPSSHSWQGTYCFPAGSSQVATPSHLGLLTPSHHRLLNTSPASSVCSSPGQHAACHVVVPGQNSLAAGRVHQQGDEGGRGWADAVEGQHGILALLLAHHVLCGLSYVHCAPGTARLPHLRF